MCYCPGCSHGALLETLGKALERAGSTPERICIVSDIGCIGTADRYFACHTFHGLHGRAITYAEGIKRARPELDVIVLVGDGGCGIGTAHLVHAARRGLGLKVLVFNNFNYGMTGGQHSATTPMGATTPTTPGGAWEHPFDICATAIVSGASYVARYSAFEPQLVDRLTEALIHPGFALVDLWELCVAYYVPSNKLTPPKLRQMAESNGMGFGVLRCESGHAHSEQAEAASEASPAADASSPNLDHRLPWGEHRTLCVAGSAGQRIRSAVGVLGMIGTAGGLHVAQQDDFPITVRKGHSISKLIVSPEPIRYAGADTPDLLVLLSMDGYERFRRCHRLPDNCTVLALDELRLPPDFASAERFSVREFGSAGRSSLALSALVAALVRLGWIAPEALRETASRALHGKYRDDHLRAIEQGNEVARALSLQSLDCPRPNRRHAERRTP